MATTKITSPELFDLGSLNTALKLPSGTTAQRPTSPSTGEWRYNTTTNLVEFWDGGAWRDLQSENIPPVNSENFNTVLYTGTSASHAITGVGFKPDLVWIKDRNNGESHIWNDSTRGAGNDLSSNSINAQANRPTGFTSFDSDGFTLGTDSGGVVNDSSRGPYVAWCWKAGGGTTSSNTEGSITSTVQANTKARFSIVKFVGTGANATVGHGLGAAPEIIIFKSSTAVSGWKMFTNQTSDPANQVMELSDPNGVAARTDAFNGTLPTSTLFSLGTYSDVNNNGNDMIAYCFASVAGYSKIGSYTGNGANKVVSTGFEPAFLIVKKTDSAGNPWAIWDNKRNTSNPRNTILRANTNDGDLTSSSLGVNFLSNGFELIGNNGDFNANGGTYLYIAFASDASAAPTLADSFGNKLYTGTGTTQSITGLGFSPSFVWLKRRDGTGNHYLNDTIRGTKSQISSNLSAAETTYSSNITSYDTDGFTLGTSTDNNASGQTFVAWNWKANSVPTINTDGTIQSLLSANQASGFSVIQYAGTGSSATIGHGLSSAPEMIIVKSTSDAYEWKIWHKDLSSGYQILFNTAGQASDSSVWTTTTPTSTVFSIGTNIGVNGSSKNYIAYAFASISGFSKIGSYNGSGSDGNAVSLGFQPSWVMIKRINSTGGWLMFDSARSPSNPVNDRIEANNNQAEQTNSGSKYVDFNATDFEANGSDSELNASGGTYLYLAFKENPVQYAIPSGQMGYLTVAGGGSGANSGAGGGAGGLRTTYGTASGGGANAETNLTLAAGTYTITVGAGGVSRGAGNSPPAYGGQGLNGSVSTITGVASVSTVGGGGGGSNSQSAAPPISASGLDGGSGGGQGPSAASGETPGSGTANEGFGGGTSSLSAPYGSGGGGGAGSAGGNRVSSTPGNGGDGLTISITGSNSGYAGGGGGSGGTSANFGLGTSGGGNGAPVTGTGISGTANTGGGGGGGGDTRAAGSGGSGIVVLRLNTSDYSGAHTGSPIVTTSGSETILTYTGSGTYVHS